MTPSQTTSSVKDKNVALPLKPADAERLYAKELAYIDSMVAKALTKGTPLYTIDADGDKIETTRIIVVPSKDIGPRMARALITCRNKVSDTDQNRKIREANIERIAKDMLTGRWFCDSGEDLLIDQKGFLIQGQHRLEALIRTGLTFPFGIKFGMRRNAMDVLDSAMTRMGVGEYERSGGKYGSVLARYTKFREGYVDGVGPTFPRFSKLELLEHMHKYSAEFNKIMDLIPKNRFDGFPLPLRAFTYYLCSQVSSKDAKLFIDKMVLGDSLSANCPILRMRGKLAEGVPGQQNDKEFNSLQQLIQTWNLWREGKPAQRLVASSKYPAPK